MDETKNYMYYIDKDLTYAQFDTEQAAFDSSVEGIKDQIQQEHYPDEETQDLLEFIDRMALLYRPK